MEPHTGLIENRFLSLLTDQRKAVGLVAWLYSTSHPRFFQLISVPSLLIFKNFLIIGSVIFIFFKFFGHTEWLAGSSFPNQGQNPCLLQWKHRVLPIEPPGKSFVSSSECHPFLWLKLGCYFVSFPACREEKKQVLHEGFYL